MKKAFQIIKETFTEFADDDCPRMAAALAYYTIFSLPPLLVLVISIAVFFGAQDVQSEIQNQIGSLVGEEATAQVQTMIESASDQTEGTWWATIIGVAALLLGATVAFAQLQAALNTAWQVGPDPERGGLKNFFFKRVLSLGMILGVAFLLLVSLVLSSLLAAFSSYLTEWLPDFLSGGALLAINEGFSFLIITFLFAAIYKVLPDAQIAWRDVGVGAAVTALLFVAGKFAISFYLGRSDISSTYGAAGSLALLLVWIYYSSLILFLGAEFTQVYARHFGSQIQPDKHAVRIVREHKYVRDGDPADPSTPPPEQPSAPGRVGEYKT